MIYLFFGLYLSGEIILTLRCKVTESWGKHKIQLAEVFSVKSLAKIKVETFE